MLWKINKRKEAKEKENDLRIVEITNGLGEKTFSIEMYNMWGKYFSMWTTEKSNIDTYENAVKLKSEIEKQILKATVVSRRIC